MIRMSLEYDIYEQPPFDSFTHDEPMQSIPD